jgi:acyl carrier protein
VGLKTALVISFFVLSALLFFVHERRERVRIQRKLAGRPQLSPAEFGQQYAPQSESKAAVACRVRAVIDSVAQQIPLNTAGLQPSDAFVQDLNLDALDSMASVELVVALEKEFAISIPDADAETMRTVADIVEYVHSRSAPAAALSA